MCPHTTICVLILLYMCPHSTIFVLILLRMCPHTTIRVLILLYMCPHSTICALILQHMCPHNTICVLILLYICPHTTGSAGCFSVCWAYVSIRQHTSASVSIHHTNAASQHQVLLLWQQGCMRVYLFNMVVCGRIYSTLYSTLYSFLILLYIYLRRYSIW